MTETNEQGSQELSPEPILQMNFSFAPSRILAAGVQLAVFTHIAAGHHTAGEIARAANSVERSMGMLLDALVGFQLLVKVQDRYELAPLSAEYLVADRPNYLGAMMESDTLLHSWDQLVDAVRTGKARQRVDEQQNAEQFFPQLVRSLHVINQRPARLTAAALGAGSAHHGLRVVDVACGSGVWGIGIAEADREARITAQDFPAIFNVTRHYIERHGMADRFDFLPGDLKQVDFGENRFDLALLGNIVHSEGENSSRDLFRRLYRALSDKGRIVIIDMVPNDERTGPPYALMFAINMLVNTTEGGTYTLAEYTEWLNEAGFKRVATADIGSHSPIVIGYKD